MFSCQKCLKKFTDLTSLLTHMTAGCKNGDEAASSTHDYSSTTYSELITTQRQKGRNAPNEAQGTVYTIITI